ncbi:MAG: tRNA glutamyl-Q(34) synthetase GluQRS [Gammaproteobacteria bacterium]|nr:tRNA glutamyl-Q(34) synthetase GluQRS [Gammaproteobacteria bacterium]
MSDAPTYRGRFAPTPSGPLHFGSIVAALASWLAARSRNGQWWLRIEDLDRQRLRPDAESSILNTLEHLGLHWDGPMLRQSERLVHYQAALERLLREGLAYPCGCSRADLVEGCYPGTCRSGLPEGRQIRSWRFRVPDGEVTFIDRIRGELTIDVAHSSGDFVIKRADGYFAYHLAVVLDDALCGMTDIVRGADLIDSTPRHILLQQALGLPTPTYAHTPVVLGDDGRKLSKHLGAPPPVLSDPGTVLHDALSFLGQRPPAALRSAAPARVLAWASENWDEAVIPRLDQASERWH